MGRRRIPATSQTTWSGRCAPPEPQINISAWVFCGRPCARFESRRERAQGNDSAKLGKDAAERSATDRVGQSIVEPTWLPAGACVIEGSTATVKPLAGAFP